MFITDERMLDVKDYCVQQHVSGIMTTADWLAAIGINPSNQTIYTTGRGSFTKHHHQAVGKLFGVSMDFLYGFSDTMFRSAEFAYTSTNIIENMRASLALLETELRLNGAPALASSVSGKGNTRRNTSLKKTSKIQKAKN